MTTWSRREQYQAYRFVSRRIASAVLSGEPEASEPPMRRFSLTMIIGTGLAVLIVAGFFVYGLLVPGGGRPAENVIILERETGASYIYLQGRLHPVLNWTSARLVLKQPDPSVRTMSQSSLRDVPRGRPVGIEGLPDTLPDSRSLTGLPWSVCTAPRSANSVDLTTQVLVGRTPAGGAPLGENEAVLVTRESGDERFVIWRDHRLRIRDNGVIAALGWAGVRAVPVSVAFLDALPPGPDLAPLRLADSGDPATVDVGGEPATIGQLFQAAGEYYVMLEDGVAPVGELTAQLLLAEGQRATEVSAPEIGQVLLETTVEPPGLPEQVPDIDGSDDRFAMACAHYDGAGDVERPVAVYSYAAVDAELTRSDPADPGAVAGGPADRVILTGGRGALAQALTPEGSPASGDVYVVTDQGIKYPVPRASRDEVLSALGYADVSPVTVPASFLALVPTGPALDPQAATIFVDPETVDDAPQPQNSRSRAS